MNIDEQITKWERVAEDLLVEMEATIREDLCVLPPQAVFNCRPFADEFNVMTQSIRDAYEKYPKIGSHKIREV